MSRLAAASVATGFLLYVVEVILWGLNIVSSLPDYFLVSISLLIIGNVLQDREFSSQPTPMSNFSFCTQCSEVSRLVCSGCGEAYCEICFLSHSVENLSPKIT